MSDETTSLELAEVAATQAANDCLREELGASSVAFHMEEAAEPVKLAQSDKSPVVLTLSGGIIMVLVVFAAWSGGLTFMDAVDMVFLKIVPLSITGVEGVLDDPANRLPWIVLFVAGVIVTAGAIFNGRNVYNIYQVLKQFQADPAAKPENVLLAVERIEGIVLMSTYVTWGLTAVQFVTFVAQLAMYEHACRRTNVVWVLQVCQFAHYVLKSVTFPFMAGWFHRMARLRRQKRSV